MFEFRWIPCAATDPGAVTVRPNTGQAGPHKQQYRTIELSTAAFSRAERGWTLWIDVPVAR